MRPLHLSHARFTLHHCYVTIDGWQADIGTKLSLLLEGVCNVYPVDMEHAAQAEALRQTPCGQDGNLLACGHCRLVELAARYWLWSNAEGEPDQDVEILDLPEARVALMRHLAILREI